MRKNAVLAHLLDLRLLGIVALVGIAVAVGSVSVVSVNEQNDQFCGMCHTQPESTFLARFDQAMTDNADDLAAFHHKQLYPPNSPTAQHIRCIDCHVGEGVVGRTIVVSLAAWDALKYVTHTLHQPATVVYNVQDAACLKCHDQQVKAGLATAQERFDINNHFHYLLFEPGAPTEPCVSCHVAHRQGSEVTAFQFRDVIIPVCQDCHQKEGKGPVKMQ